MFIELLRKTATKEVWIQKGRKNSEKIQQHSKANMLVPSLLQENHQPFLSLIT